MISSPSDSTGTPIPSWVDTLARAGHSAPSADNSQPWRFAWNEGQLLVTFDESRHAGGLGRHHPAVQMAMGAVIENMVQTAVATGQDIANWELRYRSSDDGPYLIVPAPQQPLPTNEPPEWILNRHTNRGALGRDRLPDELAPGLNALAEGSLSTRVYDDNRRVDELARLVQAASEIRFQTEEVHSWLSASLRFTAAEVERGEGLDADTLVLPPGGKQLLRFVSDWRRMAMLNKLYAYKLFALVEKMQFRKCGAVVVIAGGAEGASSWITAGRLMERAWLLLNRSGISVHPYYVVPDTFYRLKAGLVPSHLRVKAREITAATRALLEMNDETPFMVMRVGVASRSPKLAKRLPLSAVVSKLG